jgi:hypothetical protein
MRYFTHSLVSCLSLALLLPALLGHQQAAAQCASPTNLNVTTSFNTPLTGLTVTFAPGVPSVATILTYTPAGGTTTTLPSVTSPVSLTGLVPNTRYTVCLMSNCGNGTTSPVCGTASTALPCAMPTNLRLTRVGTTGNTYTFSWTGPPNGLGYAVNYSAPGVTPQFASGSQTTITVTLLPNTAYTFSVYTDCGYNNAAPAATLTVNTTLASRNATLAEQISLFPNPATRTATLRVPATLCAPGASLRLFNTLGQLVAEHPLVTTETTLDLTGLHPGIYNLLLPTTAGRLVKRLVVE